MAETQYDYYDDLVEGHEYEPFRSTVREADVQALAACVELGPLQGPDGTELTASLRPAEVSPFLLNSFLPMRACIRMPDGLLHARETLKLHAVARVGDILETVIRVKEKYLKNDRKFVLLQHDVRRPADDVHIMTILRLIAWVK